MLVTFNSKRNRDSNSPADHLSPQKKVKLEPSESQASSASSTTFDYENDTPSSHIQRPGSSSTATSSPPKSKSSKSSFKLINNTSDFYSLKATKRSKNGCLTCKIRKKKCNEQRPQCSDCMRLHKECIWVDYDSMSEAEIRELKEKVERDESHQKLRKRKSKSSISYPDSKEPTSSKSVTPETNENEHISPVKVEKDIVDKINNPARPNPFEPLPPSIHSAGVAAANLGSPSEPLRAFRYSHSDLRSTLDNNQLDPNHVSPISQLLALQSPGNDIGTGNSASFHMANSPAQERSLPTSISNLNLLAESASQTVPDSSEPLDSEFKTPASPFGFLSFLKDITNQDTEGKSNNKDSPTQNYQNQLIPAHSSPPFIDSHITDIGHMFNSPDSPMYNNYFSFSSPSNYDIPNINSMLTPLPPPPPSYLPELATPKCAYLYNYYVETLSNKISIAPSSQNESNSYQKVFLPLAHKDKGVLYGILAWSAFHLGGEWIAEGTKYVDLALEHLMKSLTELKTYNDDINAPKVKEDRQTTIIKLSTLLILCGAEICKGDVKNWSIFLNWGWKILYSHGGILKFNQSKEEHWLISNFAYHDLLASSSTERGTYFPSKDYEVIFKDKEGFSRGSLNPLLGVSKKLYKIIGDISTLLFESKEILSKVYETPQPDKNKAHVPSELGLVDESPNSVTVEKIDATSEVSEDVSEHGRINKMLVTVIQKANKLEVEIQNSKPDPDDLVGITDDELELQLTMFEAFQLSAKLFLKQAILKCNPSMLELQVINTDLIKCIDILLVTPVQASLAFPMFMSAIHCLTQRDRQAMSKRMSDLMTLYGPWNIQRVKYLVEKVWEKDPNGDTVVDWHFILRELNWDINFA